MKAESHTLELERKAQAELQESRAAWEAYLPEMAQRSPVAAAMYRARLDGDLYTSARLSLHRLIFHNSVRQGKSSGRGQYLMNELRKLPSSWRPRLLTRSSTRPRLLYLVNSDSGT